MSREDALKTTNAIGKRFLSSRLEIEAVCLGGSLSSGGTADDISDIDLFVYIDLDVLPTVDWMKEAMAAVSLEAWDSRRRDGLLESRTYIDGRDANIKFFLYKRLHEFSYAKPCLDEVYIEELHSYHNFTGITEREGRIQKVLTQVRRRRASDVLAICRRALETYGKAMSGAIKQAVFRNGHLAQAALNFSQAIQALLVIAYGQAGVYPSPIKWRATPEHLMTLPRGIEIVTALADWEDCSLSLGVNHSLRVLRSLEEAIAGSYDKEPWASCKDDTWWRQTYLLELGHLPKNFSEAFTEYGQTGCSRP